MSDKLGTITLDRERQPLFMQIQAPQEKGDYSEETAREIDCEVRRIIDEQYERVKRLLAGTKGRAPRRGEEVARSRGDQRGGSQSHHGQVLRRSTRQ